LRRAANALECDVIVAVVPRQSLSHAYSKQLRAKATAISTLVAGTMALEAQSTGVDDVVRLENTDLDDFRRKLGRNLWD
jgi:hypothetical protein